MAESPIPGKPPRPSWPEPAAPGAACGLEEVVALARVGSISAHVERYDLTEISALFRPLRDGEVDGRAVLVPARG